MKQPRGAVALAALAVSAWADVSGARLRSAPPASSREGGPFQVNTFTTGFQTEPIVASQPNGEFLVTWTSPNQDGAASGVFAQRYQPEVVFRDGFEPLN